MANVESSSISLTPAELKAAQHIKFDDGKSVTSNIQKDISLYLIEDELPRLLAGIIERDGNRQFAEVSLKAALDELRSEFSSSELWRLVENIIFRLRKANPDSNIELTVNELSILERMKFSELNGSGMDVIQKVIATYLISQVLPVLIKQERVTGSVMDPKNTIRFALDGLRNEMESGVFWDLVRKISDRVLVPKRKPRS